MHPFSFLPHGCGFKEQGPVSHRRPTVVGSGAWENNGCLAHVFKARDSRGFFGSFLEMATTLFTCFIFFFLLLQTHPGVLTSRRAGRQGSHCQIKTGMNAQSRGVQYGVCVSSTVKAISSVQIQNVAAPLSLLKLNDFPFFFFCRA